MKPYDSVGFIHVIVYEFYRIKNERDASSC